MGFWENIGEGLFGTETKKKGQALAQKGAETAGSVGDTAITGYKKAGKQADIYDKAALESMGGNAAEYMKKGQAAAQAGADQAGVAAATMGTQAGIRAARTSGLTKGQAALAAGQQAGDIYTGTYQKGLEAGQDRYQSATGQIAGQGNQMAGRQQGALNTSLGAAQTQAGIGSQQQQAAADKAANTWGTIGAAAQVGTQLATMSDERVKENVEVIGEDKPTEEELSAERAEQLLSGINIDEIAKKIRPVKYNYKQDVPGATPGDKIGVMAQDLEKTPLASMVNERPDGVKTINTGELSGANLNLIIQLAKKVSELENQLKANGVV